MERGLGCGIESERFSEGWMGMMVNGKMVQGAQSKGVGRIMVYLGVL